MATGKQLIRKFNKVRTLPHVISRLSRLIADNTSSLRDFEEIISMDPALVARLLTVVNSAYFGLITRVDSITRAVALLGMKNLHNIAVTDALKRMFATGSPNSSFSRSRLWMHCAATGICSKMIAERIHSVNGDDAYLCGVLHDIGLVVEDQVVPGQFLQAFNSWVTADTPFTELEREFIGTDHSEIGHLLARDWLLGDEVSTAIRDHHLLSEEILPESMTGILQLSEYIVSRIDMGVKPEIAARLPPLLEEHLQENAEEYQVLTDDLHEEISKAKELYTS